MILGVMGDTHKDEANAIPLIVKKFKKAGVKVIVHTGDIGPQHLDPKLFGGLPVICALTGNQENEIPFQFPPSGWAFTYPDKRIKRFENFSIYVGHKKFFELLRSDEAEFRKGLEIISRDKDGVRWLFAGHTHRQGYFQDPLLYCVNPGAVEGASWGHAFAIVHTKTREVTFSRIMPTSPEIEDFKVAVISDSKDISRLNPGFWEKLAERLKQEGAKEIIHCGNLNSKDIGIKELQDFKVHYNLHAGQKDTGGLHNNWHRIDMNCPVVNVNGYKFCVQHNLGGDFINNNEMDMLKLSLKLATKYPFIHYVLFGLTDEAVLEENEQLRIVNPGDVERDQNFVTIGLPRHEIMFGRIPFDPLPSLR